MTTDARTLAARLAAHDDAALEQLFAARGVPGTVHWRDFFDAAEGLLESASVARVLATLPRSLALELAEAPADQAVSAEATAVLAPLALVTDDGVPYASVHAAVHASAQSPAHPGERDTPTSTPPAPTPPASTPPDPDPAPASIDDTAHAAERAFTNIAALAEAVIACLHAPLARIGTGVVGAIDRRRLVELGVVDDPNQVDNLLAVAELVDLIRVVGRTWLVTEAGSQWLRQPTADRWVFVAEGLRARLPAGLRTPAGGWIDPASWAGAYPLDPHWPERAAELRACARFVGLVGDNGEEPPWATPLRQGNAADTAPLAALMPREVDRAYLQNDLTAIAPGPLAPRLDVRLRTMAVRESHAQASTYRFTADSLAGALTEGETAASMREFLSTLSLTGVPQPLDYLIERTSERHGLVRVAVDAATGRTIITSDEPPVIDMLAVDRALRPLGLTRDADVLTSRVARDAVYWALADARYPVLAVDDAERPETMHRYRLAPSADADEQGPDRYQALIAALRTGQGADADTAWLGRELDAAVRAHAVVAVMVALPDGSTREFVLEATGVGGGRLRGRDRSADVERTLPVSSIVSVRSVG